ncbi:MAG: T9SS C-terminal target domain-containing protein, partial [Vicingaceae bacterium]
MNLQRIISGLALMIIGFQANAIEDPTSKKKSGNPTKASAAECAPANGLDYLELNAAKALIETGGGMWQDRPNSAAAYEIPKGSGSTSIYSGSLWMGGTDANDQLKIAAVTFRNGTNDFWTGPLTTDGSAEITPDVCTEYDRFFHITRPEVDLFLAWWNCKSQDIGCDAIPEGYKIPRVILEWPAHGDEGLGQDFYLAPFFDRDGDGIYDPENSGDYPYYDVNGDIDCRAVRDIRLFGDDTYWWVFNDKGNIHTETNGASIGMEIRAQAFAFATNDEVNDMTFYNYELINRSTFTLFNTYFGQWVDPDLGCANDDFVGCDVQRGLGYCYNGDDNDEDCNGALGYGQRPPAVGIDFFEGPYQDNDGINNLYGIGKDEALNGIGYLDLSLPETLRDSIIDNERYGMRRFIYYNRGGGIRGDAQTALDHYNYLRSIWRDGNKMVYGGNGYPGDAGATSIEADFMFPDGSDPLNWGTRGEDPGGSWTEITAGNPPFDRRFLQSAGPFTLEPGAINDITVGVVWARAISGSAFESVNKLFQADTKAQALFDNCFKVLNGPDAPDLSGVELDKEIILYITNKKGLSNNFKQVPGDYEEVDPFIVAPEGEVYDNKYRFQGYLIYQVSDVDVKASELDNLDRARLAFQCDIKDNVADIVNYTFDDDIGATVPEVQVKNAANDGIVTTFRVTEDLFASGDPKLVNFKTYYFLAIAYAYNNFKTYSETPDGLDGQKLPFLASRRSTSGEVTNFSFVPHKQEPKNGGTIINSNYGDQPRITRIEGQGNGGFNLAFTPATLERLLETNDAGSVFPTYQAGRGPVGVKVIDPTNVYDGDYVMQVYEEDGEFQWKVWREGAGSAELNDTVFSEAPLSIEN